MVFCFDKKNRGFTILELTVVMLSIVIIAMIIPVAISQQFVISDNDSSDYVNAQKIKVALVKNDLKKAAAQLAAYKSKYGQFPLTNRCDKIETNQNICLISYQSTIYKYQANIEDDKYILGGIRFDLKYLFEVSSENSTPQPKKLITINSISAADDSTCAISSENELTCWGEYWHYTDDQNGVSRSDLLMTKFNMNLFDTKNLFITSNSSDHSCAIFSGLKAYCWGVNNEGQLGSNNISNDDSAYRPTQLSSMDFADINANGLNSCAVDVGGLGYCWGDNNYGQVGNNSNIDVSVPTKVKIDGVKFVSIKTASHTCGLSTDYKLYCWGRNNYGQVGNGNTINQKTPNLISDKGELSGKRIIKYSVADDHTCALTSEAKIYCWGQNNVGQLGNNSNVDSKLPKIIYTPSEIGVQTFKDLSIADGLSCGLTGNNLVFCWGDNSKMQIGSATLQKSNKPVQINGDSYFKNIEITSLSTASDHVCALDSRGFVYCWGDNSQGQLGDGTIISSEKPLFVMPLSL